MVGCSFGVLLIFYVLSVMSFMVSFTGLAGFQLVLILMHCIYIYIYIIYLIQGILYVQMLERKEIELSSC